MRFDRRLPLLLLLAACAAPKTTAPSATAEASDVAAAPRVAIAAGASDVEVLLDEAHVSYDEAGRMSARYRLRYRIEKASALETAGVVEAGWTPWFEDRPELRATVTRADGTTSELDPATIEASTVGGRGVMFADNQQLRAPLPNLEVGAVVERVVEGRDREPFFTGGRRGYFHFQGGASTRSRLTLDVPAKAPLVWVARGLEIEPIEDVIEDGRRRLVFEGGPYTDEPKREPYAPWDAADEPHIVFSVAPSWAAIARAYAERVDERIAAGPPETTRREGESATLIRELLAEVHQRVRYTGLELGVQAIIPVSPKDVLERGYGDCKDKATLLVALLRAHGIDAYVALVRAGVAPVEARAPGLDAFNHAIVFVPGPEPLWIDATADQLPVGDLPLSVQGQSALVARASEDALVPIPETSAAANLYLEERAITMAAFGPGRVVERMSGRGATAEWIRRRYIDLDETKLAESMKDYVANVYGAEKIIAVERVGFESVDAEAVLRIEAEAPNLSQTSDFDAEVALDITPLLDHLPAVLQEVPKPGAPLEPRTRPLRFYRPVAGKMVYRVEMPKGFVLRAVPPSKTEQLGPATLRRSFEQQGGTIVATYVLDAGPRLWRASDVDAFRKKYPDLVVRDVLQMEHEGEQLRAEGSVVEALALYRRLTREDPGTGRHHARLAQVLLEVGLADEARREAERAIEAAPDDPGNHFVLGWVLGCDELGQPNLVPVDRDGAIAAYRRALELGSKEPMTRQNLAVLLETNAHGERYGRGADLASAAEVYRAYREELSRSDLDENLMIVLMRLERYDEVFEVAKRARPTALRNAMLVVAKLMTKGVRAARATLSEEGLSAEEQQVAWTRAREALFGTRQYEAAQKIVASLTQGSDSLASRAALARVNGIRRYEEVVADRTGFEAAATRWLVASTRGTWTPEELEGVYSKAALAEFGRGGLLARLRALRKSSRAGIQKLNTAGLVRETGVDVVVHLAGLTSEGSDEVGRRVVVRMDGAPLTTLFVTKEGEGYRVRADGGDRAGIAAEALARLERGDPAGARRWFAWATDEAPGEFWKKVRVVWGEGAARTDASLRLAAAMVMAGDAATAKAAAPVLAKAAASASEEHRPWILHAASIAHRLDGKPEASVRYAEALRALRPDWGPAQAVLVVAYKAAGRPQDARAVLQASVEADPLDKMNRFLLASLDGEQGRYAEAANALTALVDGGWASAAVRNERAWLALFSGDRGSMLQDALAAASDGGFSNAARVHTLAAVYAELGQVGPALQALRRLYALAGYQMTPPDWFVLGRLAETYGFADAARAAYGRALSSDGSEEDSMTSTAVLVRARLERMGAVR